MKGKRSSSSCQDDGFRRLLCENLRFSLYSFFKKKEVQMAKKKGLVILISSLGTVKKSISEQAHVVPDPRSTF
jgi:hypothetical protein